MSKLFWFPSPLEAKCELRHDADGIVRLAVNDTHPSGRVGKSWDLPGSLPDKNGARIITSANDYYDLVVRGVLDLHYYSENLAGILIDDVVLTKKPAPCPDPVPVPPNPPVGNIPLEIINGVYATGLYNLATKDGCGKFTEACCTELHKKDSTDWGHIKKTGAQNQYNGHAVDSIMLKWGTSTTKNGIYDIITDSESTNAKPAFNWKDVVDLSLWYYPA